MDGESVCQAFGAFAGPDCLGDVLPKYGTRLKVYNAIKRVMNKVDSSSSEQVYIIIVVNSRF